MKYERIFFPIYFLFLHGNVDVKDSNTILVILLLNSDPHGYKDALLASVQETILSILLPLQMQLSCSGTLQIPLNYY